MVEFGKRCRVRGSGIEFWQNRMALRCIVIGHIEFTPCHPHSCQICVAEINHLSSHEVAKWVRVTKYCHSAIKDILDRAFHRHVSY